MAIDVSQHLEQRIRDKLREGRYRTADELLADALSSLDEVAAQRRKQAIAAAVETFILHGRDPGPPDGVTEDEWATKRDAVAARLRADIAVALASAERGDLVDGDPFVDELLADLPEESDGREGG